MALEPITRQEQIIAGKDLEPITRMEKFLKEYGGGGGTSGSVQSDWNQTDSSAADFIKNKPFGDANTVILEEQELQYDAEASGCTGTLTHPIRDGDALAIVYDGETYECTAVFLPQLNCVGFGNLSLFGGNDTGDPFFGLSEDYNINIANIDLANTKNHTVKITAVVTTKIPTKYLPDSIGGVQYVTIGMDEYDNYTASATHDQISEWIRAGKDVKCILGTLVLSLCYSDALADVSTYVQHYRHEFFCLASSTGYQINIHDDNTVFYSENEWHS